MTSIIGVLSENQNDDYFPSISEVNDYIKGQKNEIFNDQKTFEEMEKVSNMIMNKIFTKEGSFYKKDGRKAKEDYFYNSEIQILRKTEEDIISNIFKYYNSLEE